MAICFFFLKVRRNIPCHVKDISCGNVCRKLLKCEHKCQKVCHKVMCKLGLHVQDIFSFEATFKPIETAF